MLTHPQYHFTATARPINLFMAGYGSGKTRSMGDLSLLFISVFPDVVGLIGANTFSQLTRSTLLRIYQVWEEHGVTEYTETHQKGSYVVGKIPPRHFKKSRFKLDDYSNVISFINGATVFKGTLENYKALDGMEVGWAMLDETKDTRSEAMGVIISRLRQKGLYLKEEHIYERDKKSGDYSPFSLTPTDRPINPLYVFTAPAKEPWLNAFFRISDLRPEDVKPRLFEKPHYYHKVSDHQQIMIASTYTNAKNLPTNYIPALSESMGKAFVDMFIYSYPFSASGGEFYKDFNREKHVKPCEYNPGLPLHITFDENVVPYQPAGVWQVIGKKAYKIAEFAMEAPRNNIFELCKELGKVYGGHSAGVYIYGDATSLKRDSKQRLNENFFTIVRRELYEWKPVMRVPQINPDVILRGSFMNAIFRDNIFDIEISIDPSCKKSIEDFEFIKEDSDGKKRKEVYTDPMTKVSYQRWGHCFTGDTMIETREGKKRIDEVKVGDYVHTRKGLKRVTKTFYNGIREVRTYNVGDRQITCTPDHKFYADGEFTEISKLKGWNVLCMFYLGANIGINKKVKIVGLRSGWDKVYDIQVEGEHEYFANGILVHNCSDADDYFILEIFRYEYSSFLKKAKNKDLEIKESEQMDRMLRKMPNRDSKKF